MLTIRQAQIAIFSESEQRKFEDWTLIHLKKFFPKQCAAAGEARLRETIRYGIQRAAAYGFTAKSDVTKYIDIMVVFGRDFDVDKRQAWAGEILRARRNPNAKMQSLHEAARNRLRRS